MRRLTSLFIIVLVGGVVAAAYALHVDQVRVTGLKTLAAADVIKASGVEPGQRILWIRLSAAARRVERIPAVERASATRTLPGTVVIHITERRPIVKLGSGDLVADGHARVFEDAHPGRIPVLLGWHMAKGSRRVLDAGSHAVLSAFERFPAALRRQARKVVVRPSFALDLKDVEVRFGRIANLDAKAAAALAVLRAEAGKRILYVDVQVPTVPVVGPVPTPTPAPTAAPYVPTTAPPAPTPSKRPR